MENNADSAGTLQDIWQTLARAEDLAENEKKHVLCVLDANALCQVWEEAQNLLEKKGLGDNTISSSATSASNNNGYESQENNKKRQFLAAITERAANLSTGGSVTLLISVDRNLGHASGTGANISKDGANIKNVRELQSLSDGHLWLDYEVGGCSSSSSQCYLNPQKSLTRFGLGTDKNALVGRNKTLQQIGGHLRMNLMSSGASFTDVSTSSSKKESASKSQQSPAAAADSLQRTLFSQVAVCLRKIEYMPVEEQIVLLLAASTHVFEQHGSDAFQFLDYVKDTNPKLLEKIRDNGAENCLSDVVAKELNLNVQVFKALQAAGKQ